MTAARKSIFGIALLAISGILFSVATAVRAPAEQVTVEAPQSAPVATATPPIEQAPVALAAPAPARTTDGVEVVTVEDILATRDDNSPDAAAVLLAGIESTDAVVVAESTNALVGRGATWALPVLLEQDVIARPAAAPSIIDAMGRLGAVAAPEQRSEVVDRLVELLNVEKTRGAQESQGNLLQIYEALGQTGDPRAVDPLTRELNDRSVMTAPKVVIVQALVALHATTSIGALETLHAQLAASKADGFEAELQRELLGVIRDALARLT